MRKTPVLLWPCSVAAPDVTWSGPGAELGPGPRVRDTDRGAGREAFRGEGREALRVAGGFRALLQMPGLLSAPCSACPVFFFTKKEEVEPP